MTPPPAQFERLQIPNGYAAEFGAIFARRDGAGVWLGFRVDDSHCDVDGACHPGALATFADLQLAALQRTGVFPLGRHPTVSLSLDFLGPARPGDWVACEIELVDDAGGLVFTQTVARVENRPIARANALYVAAASRQPPPAAAIVADVAPAPSDYVALDATPGYGERFGPVYRRDGARLGFRVAAKHGNVWGVCHGGALATFALWQREPLRLGRAIRLCVDYLAPARLGDWVECEASLVRATRQFLFTRAVLTVAGRSIARADAIFAAAEVSGS